MARVIKPPEPLLLDAGAVSVFLAGSIEMGAAEDWQEQVARALEGLPLVVLNPRREAWDDSWVQSIDSPPFREQVEWELAAQERANVIAMYFAPTTKAPVTLLELGLAARSGKLVVCCPDGFWRKGNVAVVCARYGVPMVNELTELVRLVRRRTRHTMTKDMRRLIENALDALDRVFDNVSTVADLHAVVFATAKALAGSSLASPCELAAAELQKIVRSRLSADQRREAALIATDELRAHLARAIHPIAPDA